MTQVVRHPLQELVVVHLLLSLVLEVLLVVVLQEPLKVLAVLALLLQQVAISTLEEVLVPVVEKEREREMECHSWV